MNQFFFEMRATEKLKELRREGQASQAIHRSRASKSGLLRAVSEQVLGFVRVISQIAVVQIENNKNAFARNTQKNTFHPRKQTRYGTTDR